MNSSIAYEYKKSFLQSHKYTFLFLINFVLLAILKEAYVYALAMVLIVVSLENSKKHLPMSLLFLSMMPYLNPFLGAMPSVLWNLSLILFTALILIKKNLHVNKLEISYLAILLSFLVTSLIVSPLPSIAIIKVISLTIFSFVAFKTYKWGIINESILLQFIEAIVIANIALYFMPLGYYINGLFMGVFSHSQNIGIFLVPLLSYYTINFLENNIIGKVSKLFSLFIIFLGILEIFSTYSRTSIFTYVVLIAIYIILNKLKFKKIFSVLKSPFYFLLSIVILGGVAINTPKILNATQNYIYKSVSSEAFESKYEKGILFSRQAIYEESLLNIERNPILGNGLGVQFHNGKVESDQIKFLPLLNVPYTMEREKGNVYLMVLEEGGFITLLLLVLFILLQLKKTKNYPAAFYSSIAIFTMFNGEATLFSINGTGAFQFVFLILLYFLAIRKVKEKSKI